jgi:hypothetical protein
MHHRISDYTESDLTVALSSPFNTPARQLELEAEDLKRKEFDREQIESIQPIN